MAVNEAIQKFRRFTVDTDLGDREASWFAQYPEHLPENGIQCLFMMQACQAYRNVDLTVGDRQIMQRSPVRMLYI